MRYHQDSCAKQGFFVVCRFNCVREICVRPIPVAMKRKFWNFHTKITLTQLEFKISPRIFTKLGVLGIGQSKKVIQNFSRPTLVTTVTKNGKFQQKIGYNTAGIWDIFSDIIMTLVPNRGFYGSATLTMTVYFVLGQPCCHGNENLQIFTQNLL